MSRRFDGAGSAGVDIPKGVERRYLLPATLPLERAEFLLEPVKDGESFLSVCVPFAERHTEVSEGAVAGVRESSSTLR
jgi:hypothetical protein